jgi:DGQHR domain-containing protein
MKSPSLKLPALEIRQGPSRVIYSFAVDGKMLPHFTAIARIGRDDDQAIRGYQRPEVISHIQQIRDYLESEAPLLPNSLVVAFDRRVKFIPSNGKASGSSYSRVGELVVPSANGDEAKAGWIVDGQQRAAAIREANVKSFPISVVGFIAADQAEQTEQFILVNSTKPLPKGLLYELLPNTAAKLPELLERRRFPAYLLDLLNHDDDSPLRGMIATPTTPDGLIKDNSILKMLENSLSDGVLYRFRDPGRSLVRLVERRRVAGFPQEQPDGGHRRRPGAEVQAQFDLRPVLALADFAKEAVGRLVDRGVVGRPGELDEERIDRAPQPAPVVHSQLAGAGAEEDDFLKRLAIEQGPDRPPLTRRRKLPLHQRQDLFLVRRMRVFGKSAQIAVSDPRHQDAMSGNHKFFCDYTKKFVVCHFYLENMG